MAHKREALLSCSRFATFTTCSVHKSAQMRFRRRRVRWASEFTKTSSSLSASSCLVVSSAIRRFHSNKLQSFFAVYFDEMGGGGLFEQPFELSENKLTATKRNNSGLWRFACVSPSFDLGMFRTLATFPETVQFVTQGNQHDHLCFNFYRRARMHLPYWAQKLNGHRCRYYPFATDRIFFNRVRTRGGLRARLLVIAERAVAKQLASGFVIFLTCGALRYSNVGCYWTMGQCRSAGRLGGSYGGGDEITVVLDLNRKTVAFRKNGKDIGTTKDIRGDCAYKFAIEARHSTTVTIVGMKQMR